MAALPVRRCAIKQAKPAWRRTAVSWRWTEQMARRAGSHRKETEARTVTDSIAKNQHSFATSRSSNT